MKFQTQFMVAGAVALLTGLGTVASAQEATNGIQPRFQGLPRIVVPASSIKQPGDAGHRAHTNVRILNVNAAPNSGPPYSGYLDETPASLACVYGLVKAASGCNPNVVTTVATGGSKAIAIVDAYDDPTAASDLEYYSKQFGLPTVTASNFEVVYATGTKPAQDSTGGWELEESLDIEMAHALAPKAKVYLVEAASNSNTDLFTAEKKAASLVAAAGGGEVTNSWGEGEYSGETSDDSNFKTSKVVYFASTGDAPGTEYPSVSPYIVAAGGTSISRNTVTGDYQGQITWDQGGGGPSQYESIPSYQKSIASIVGTQRGVPDISFDANPETGVWVLDSTPLNGQGGSDSWWLVGGTSVASPALAALVNAAGSFHSSTASELNTIYAHYTDKSYFTDITSGGAGPYEGYLAVKGWDFTTGVGAPYGLTDK
jgi:subtilase family serine protease